MTDAQNLIRRMRSAEFAERICKILKERRLARNRNLDDLGRRLASQPTYREIQETRMVLNLIANNLIGD